MRNLASNPLKFHAAALGLVFFLLANHAGAAILYWNNNGSSTPTSGTWDTTTTQWSTGTAAGGTKQAWSTTAAAAFHAGSGTDSITITVGTANLAFAGFQDYYAPSTTTVTINQSGSGSLSINSGLQGWNNGGGPMTINVPLVGSGGIAFQSGNCSLYAANSYSGGTQVGYTGFAFGGLVYFNHNTAFGSGTITLTQYGNGAALVASGSSALTIANAVTVASSTTNNLVGDVTGGVTWSGNWSLGTTTFGLENGNSATYSNIISGPISGSGTLIVMDPGLLFLTAANPFSGALQLNSSLGAPTVIIGGSGSLGSGTYAGAIANSGTFTWNSSAAQTLSGAFTSSSGTFNVNGTGTLTLSGSADNSSLGATVNNGAKLVLGKASTSSVHALGSTTTVNSGGTLQLGSSGTGGDQIYSGVNVTVNSGGVFDANGKNEGMTSLTLSGTGISSAGALVNSASATTATITGTAATGFPLGADTSMGGVGNLTLAGVIGGAHALTYVGSGTLTLNSANTYSGSTTISSGTVSITGTSTLGDGTGTLNLSGGTLTTSATRTPSTAPVANPINLTADSAITTASTAGTVDLNLSSSSVTATSGKTLTFQNNAASGSGVFQPRFSGSFTFAGKIAVNNGSFGTTKLQSFNTTATGTQTFNGAISGTGSYNRTATTSGTGGTTVFNAANTYSGGTTVNDGTLEVGASGSIQGNVTVGSQGVLQLDNASALSSSATLALPSSPASGMVNLNFSGTQTISALNFGSTSMAQGTWGSTSSSATHKNAAFTGTGLLSITSGGANPTIGTPVMTPNPPCPGAAVSLTATVSGGNSPSGSVQFFDGATSLGTGTLASGTATLSPAVGFSPGTHSITAQYLGDNQNNATAASSALVVTVSGTPTIATQPANTTVCSGSTAAFSVTAAGTGLNYSWAAHNNGGWGNAWSASGNGTTFLGSATDNNQSNPNCDSFSSAGDINSTNSSDALGIWGGNDGSEAATRAFPALTSGQVVSVDFDNGNVDSSSKVGFSLQTSGGADVLQFYFLGGQSNYKYWDDVTGERDSGIGWGYTGMRVQFVLTSSSTYSLLVTPCGGTTTLLSGTFSGASIAQVKLFNGNTGSGDAENCYFNNFIVGGYVDNADNYSGSWAGQNKGDQPIASGNGSSSYTTPALSVADSGSQYEVVVYGCGGAVLSGAAAVTVNPLPSVSVNSETVCAGTSATLTATTGASSPSYSWSPGGATTSSITVSPSSTTTYTVTVTDGTTSCANSGSGTVTVNAIPSTPTAGSDSPVLPGATLHLTASTVAGATYSWTGPNSFTSSDQNPTISSVTRADNAGTYSVTATVSGCTSAAGTTSVIVNTPPTAPNSTAGVTENSNLVLSVAKLLVHASDADAGDTLSVTAAGPTSTNGPANNVVLDTGAGTITYTPATDFTGTDTFTYTISDNYGGTVTPTITVTVTGANVPSPNIVVAPAYDSESGTFSVTFAGIPGYTYTIQTATSPTGPWSFLKTATAGSDGLFQVLDTEASPPPERYYRTVYP